MVILIGLAFALAAYFPVMLGLRSDWRANGPGKSLMVFSSIIAGVFFLVFLRTLGYDLPEWIRAVVYMAIIVGLASQAVTLTKVQNRRAARIAREREQQREIVQ